MKIGDIIRKTTASGLPIGQYMRIIKLDGDRATVIGDKTRNAFSMLVTHVRVYSKIAVQVSEEDYLKLKLAWIQSFKHVVNRQFDTIDDNPPDVVEFWCRGKKKHLFFRLDFCQRVIYDKKKCIKLYFTCRLFYESE